MIEISTKTINEAIYKLCYEANICLDNRIYSKILNAYNYCEDGYEKYILKNILINAKIAYEKKLPLCQDSGQVIVFVEIGQNINLTGNFIEDEINSAVEKCYSENFFRKSTVKNALFDRTNTKTNTPVIIHTKFIKENEVRLKVLIKGAGSENKTGLIMMLPSSSEDEVVKAISDMIIKIGTSACPPMFIGIAIGATSEKSAIMAKEVFFKTDFSDNEITLANKIKNKINKNFLNLKNYVLDIKLTTTSTHIACMPISISVNCHSDRISECIIKENNITYLHQKPNFIDLNEDNKNLKEIKTQNKNEIINLKSGETILLTGEIYVARDMAHKRLTDLMEQNKALPINLKDKIIFYAGPAPEKEGEIIGSIGPTTASRMDKYAEKFYENGIIATIGKGERSLETEKIIKKLNGKYFSVIGGIAALLAQKVKSKEVIAFEDLDPEAIYKLYIEKLPVKVEF